MRLSSAPTPGSCTSQHRKQGVRQGLGNLGRGLAHAEADFQHEFIVFLAAGACLVCASSY
jgi:hypothetical protein